MINCFIRHVVRAPYICTVLGGGVRQIKCYPDAQTFIIKGKLIGHSRKEQTMIAPLDMCGRDICLAKETLIRFLDTERRTQQK